MYYTYMVCAYTYVCRRLVKCNEWQCVVSKSLEVSLEIGDVYHTICVGCALNGVCVGCALNGVCVVCAGAGTGAGVAVAPFHRDSGEHSEGGLRAEGHPDLPRGSLSRTREWNCE